MKSKNKIQKLYSRRAETYESIYVKRLGWGEELYTFFAGQSYLKPELNVLDAGCGTGVITRILHRLAEEKGYENISFHAFDLTPAMLEIFQKHIPEEKGNNKIDLAQADVLQPDSFPPGWKEYDFIVSSALLEYIPKEEINNALNHLQRLLKKDGKLLVFITRQTFITSLAGKLWWKTHLFEEAAFHQTLQNAGFKHIKLKSLPSRWGKFIMVIEAGN